MRKAGFCDPAFLCFGIDIAARRRARTQIPAGIELLINELPLLVHIGGGPGLSRTDTSLSEQRILSPVRLPVPPRGQMSRLA
jgi:hypothetical protein